MTLAEPATVGEVADRAGHGVDAARESLAWVEAMGIVRRRSETPATYERNESYFERRRVDRLRATHTTEELLDRLEADTERAAAFAEQFDADSPAEVSPSAHATETGRSVEAVWEDISAWRTVRRRIELVERALESDGGDAAERRRVA
ncbi:hypothetical protein [Halobaculum sp. MBLA0143]|uniref:DUF7342 family protein n=1 Tax=Halobaculum sp. MBLA0143 TaxID=3079933 RepID=UPI0035236F68